jgi:hypothetical protein
LQLSHLVRLVVVTLIRGFRAGACLLSATYSTCCWRAYDVRPLWAYSARPWSWSNPLKLVPTGVDDSGDGGSRTGGAQVPSARVSPVPRHERAAAVVHGMLYWASVVRSSTTVCGLVPPSMNTFLAARCRRSSICRNRCQRARATKSRPRWFVCLLFGWLAPRKRPHAARMRRSLACEITLDGCWSGVSSQVAVLNALPFDVLSWSSGAVCVQICRCCMFPRK